MIPLKTQIQSILHGRILILGVGNRLRGDDAAGSVLIDKIKDCIPVGCIDAGVAPENYLEKVIKNKTETLLIVDAVNFGGREGEIRLFNDGQVSGDVLSTHALSLRLACDYLKARIPIHIFLIGIQPGSLQLGREAGAVVSGAVDELAETLIETLKNHA